MKTVRVADMRALDARTIHEHGVPGEVLMERAGSGVAACLLALAERASRRGRVWIIAGKGNNGGDAFVAARRLARSGMEVRVGLVAAPDELRGDARVMFDRMTSAGIVGHALADLPPEDEATAFDEWVIDGILGTGLAGPATGAAAAAIAAVNRLGRRRGVVAIDGPSGLNADDGTAPGPVVRADLTVTMGLPKRGLLLPEAIEAVGNLDVVDIGIPAAYTADLASDLHFLAASDVRAIVNRRRRGAHKGDYGHVLIVGGRPGFAGAPAMAAQAALRAGVGLVSVLVPSSIWPAVSAMVPEAMVYPGQAHAEGCLRGDAWDTWTGRPANLSAVLCGPGMGRHPDGERLCERILAGGLPVVLDADALPVPLTSPLARPDGAPVVVTPHPGEMGRMLGSAASVIQADRFGSVREARRRGAALTILKGAGTVLTDGRNPLTVNMTGNPGMATGGTGDVLAGFLAGLLAQDMPAWDAARLAVYAHGWAGDAAAGRLTQPALGPRDILAALPEAWRALGAR